jgi:hypothetical protein
MHDRRTTLRFPGFEDISAMKRAETNSSRTPLLVASVAALLFALLGATTSGPWPDRAAADSPANALASASAEDTPGSTAQPPARTSQREASRCSYCGIVESTRRVAANGSSPEVYQVTVRLADRSKHVFSDPDAGKWRPGERIVLIGAGTSTRH